MKKNSYVFLGRFIIGIDIIKCNLLCDTNLQVQDEFLDLGLCKSTVAAR